VSNHDESFDAAYSSSDRYFGDGPEKLLTEYSGILDPGRPVLDVGAGQGRNALYLAGAGFEVDAIDPSGEAGALFPGYETVHHREGPGPVHRHGDGPEERHDLVEMVLQR
jgi:SAM-dependent methyltransferase